MLAQVLCHKNHPRIRIFGFRLLLLWINDQTVEYPEAIYLFSNAISLDLFMYDGEDLSIDHASATHMKLPALGNGSTADGPPICPNPLPPTFQDSIQLFQIFLANIVRMAYVAAGSTPPPGELESINSHHPLEAIGDIGDGIAVGFGIDAGLAAARFMFDIVKKYYLVKVFPDCARNLHLLKDEGQDFGYQTCPPTILRTIIGFVIQYCLDSNEFNSPLGHTSPATPILKSIVYSSEINREIMHEIVRQGLRLPAGHPQYKDIVRGATHIVGVWCLSSEEERPVFLRSTSSRPHTASSTSVSSLNGTAPSEDTLGQQEPCSTANSFLQRYFQLLTKVFYDKPLTTQDVGSNSSSEALGSTASHTKIDPEALLNQYKDIVGLLRAIVSRSQIQLNEESWRVLLGSLLEIQRRVMNQPEKYSTPIPPSSTDDLVSLIVETVLCAYSRCPNVSNGQWIELRKTMISGLRWPQAVAQWTRWSLRLTHLISAEVFQVDLEGQNNRTLSSTGARHARKMSDKFRHSRYLSSKTDNPLRHSIGGELLSSQGILFAQPTYSLPNAPGHERSSRRANSVHYDANKQPLLGTGVSSSGSAVFAPTLLGHMGFLPSRELGREFHPTFKPDLGECDEEPFERGGSHAATMGDPSMDITDDKLPLVKTEAVLCLIDIWDILNQTRTAQPANATLIPPLYDFAPWFFEAAKSTNDGGIGRPAIYGGLCRMMSRRYDQDFDPSYYSIFYECIVEMLKDGQLRDGVSHFSRKQAIAILCSVCMFFYDIEPAVKHAPASREQPSVTASVGSYLIPYKLTFTRLVLDLTLAEANVKPLGKFWDTHSMLIQLCGILVINEWSSSIETCDIGAESELLLCVLDHLYWTEASIVQSAVEVVSTLAGMYQDHEDNGWHILEMVLSHLLSAMQEHLKSFQGESRRGTTVSSLFRCLTEWLMVIPASVFSDTDLSEWVFELIETGLSVTPELTDSDPKRAAVAQARTSFRANKRRGPSFKHTCKTLHQHHRIMLSAGTAHDAEIEQLIVREAAEATLVHIVHFLNNIPSAFGPGIASPGSTRQSDRYDNSNGHKEKNSNTAEQMVFSLNNSILITLEEVPRGKMETPRTRIHIRDETGLYSWDSEIFYKEVLLNGDHTRPQSPLRSGSRRGDRFGSTSRRKKLEMAGQLIWRAGVKVRGDDAHADPVESATSQPSQDHESAKVEPPLWENTMIGNEDKLDHLLQYIGHQHPDCLFDGKTPLNQLNNGMAMSTGSRFPSTIDAELNRHVQEEHYYTRISDPQARAWYDKLVELRSSLIQADEDLDEQQGSNTLMSLVNSNWGPDVSSTSLADEHPVRATSRRLSSRFWYDFHERRSESDTGDRPIQASISSTSVSDLVQTDLQTDDFSIAKAFQLVLPPEPERPMDNYQHSRLLLSHLGLLCFERFQEHNFILLNQSSSLYRDLKSLDKRSGRETFKIALLYVGPGQENEQAILRNNSGSEAYNRFVNDLGWPVDLADHTGYLGGLERNGSNGTSAIYCCSSTLEIIFHETIRMPTDLDDPRQVKKKRHIGNDHVHIIWSEHSRPYARSTIGGDFGNVLIVLSPVPILTVEGGCVHVSPGGYSGLVSVEIIRDSNLPVFGPLVDGMVVPASRLGPLVRQTAIHASRLATAPPPLPPTPPSSSMSSTATVNSTGKSVFHTASGSTINSAMHGHQYHQSSPSLSATATGSTAAFGQGTSSSTIGASITNLVTNGIAGVSLSSSSSPSSTGAGNGHGPHAQGGIGESGHSATHSSIGGGIGGSSKVPYSQGHPFKQRALAIEQISRRHKMEKWTFQQFMEQVFGYSRNSLQHQIQ
ncbi:Ral GTPase-activating protein subunit alpha-1 [Podila epigama]|nr:Ral GTPase-activating protein subunit alpha-1 [Podila epigama]